MIGLNVENNIIAIVQLITHIFEVFHEISFLLHTVDRLRLAFHGILLQNIHSIHQMISKHVRKSLAVLQTAAILESTVMLLNE